MLLELIPVNWEILKEMLSDPFDSLDDIYTFLSYASGNGNLNCIGLEQLDQDCVLSIFNFIRSQSLLIEAAFSPEQRSLSILESGYLSLKREQILVLLCHMTLLTLKPTKKHVYWVNFDNWLTDGRPCAQAYLQGLFSYFALARDRLFNEPNWRNEIVTFERRRQQCDAVFPMPELKVSIPTVHLTGSIGDHSRNVVDFANEFIGFGIGGTQEEILFASFIELCPAMIFCCNAMEKDEAIVIRNAIKYIDYSGYGFKVKFEGINPRLDSYNVIAIDALDFSANYMDALKLQLKPSNLQRELIKLLAGFSAIQSDSIDTGHWGCGAFGGNKSLKAVLQLIAATLTGNTLSFCCFGDEEFYNSFEMFIEQLERSQTSISLLWDTLMTIDSEVQEFTFNHFSLK